MNKLSDVLVSIVIPCYNTKSYISESIESAINQTFKNCEVIVVNDGSTDSSLQIINSYRDRIKIIDQANQGGCSARNRGLDFACGEFVQFLDADDILSPECIEKKLLEPSEPSSVVCSRLKILEGYDPSKMTYFWMFDSYSPETMLLHGTPQTSAPLHRKKDLMSVGGFKVGLAFAQEFDLHLKIAFGLKKTFKVIDHEGVYIRPRSDSLSRCCTTKKNPHVVANILEDVFNKYGESFTVEEKKAFSFKAALIARSLYKVSDKIAGDHWFKISKNLDPVGIQKAYKNHLIYQIAKTIGHARFEMLHSVFKYKNKSV